MPAIDCLEVILDQVNVATVCVPDFNRLSVMVYDAYELNRGPVDVHRMMPPISNVLDADVTIKR